MERGSTCRIGRRGSRSHAWHPVQRARPGSPFSWTWRAVFPAAAHGLMPAATPPDGGVGRGGPAGGVARIGDGGRCTATGSSRRRAGTPPFDRACAERGAPSSADHIPTTHPQDRPASGTWARGGDPCCRAAPATAAGRRLETPSRLERTHCTECPSPGWGAPGWSFGSAHRECPGGPGRRVRREPTGARGRRADLARPNANGRRRSGGGRTYRTEAREFTQRHDPRGATGCIDRSCIRPRFGANGLGRPP